MTSQVLRTAARRIQRNVGFEFEANWHASWYDAKESGGILDQSAFSRDTLSKGGKLPTFKPIPKATKIISAKDVDLTADEAQTSLGWLCVSVETGLPATW